MSSTSDAYRRWANELRAAAATLEAEAARHDSADAATRVAAERAREAFEARIRLHIATRVDISDPTQMGEEKTTATGRKVTVAHKMRLMSANASSARNATKFAKWLASKGWTASDWAHAHPAAGRQPPAPRWSVSAVRSWIQPQGADGARAIPEEAANLIAIESKGAVPATEATWPSGISTVRHGQAK